MIEVFSCSLPVLTELVLGWMFLLEGISYSFGQDVFFVLAAFEQDQVLLESCLQTCMTYTITECIVNELLMMDRGIIRNM